MRVYLPGDLRTARIIIPPMQRKNAMMIQPRPIDPDEPIKYPVMTGPQNPPKFPTELTKATPAACSSLVRIPRTNDQNGPIRENIPQRANVMAENVRTGLTEVYTIQTATAAATREREA